ncbi:adhesin [Salmonella enterica subsp. enterica]|nr:adhesin [Salmonella enterica subsp. enterica]
MNKIFKVIWNPATGAFTVASETAKSRGKKSGRRKLLASALLVTSGMLASFGAGAAVEIDGGTSADTPTATDYWIAIGQGAQATAAGEGTSSMAIGYQSFSGIGSTALGYGSKASGERSVSLGQISEASGDRAIAVGSGAHATEKHSIAMGLSANSNAEDSIALGSSATTKGVGSIALGVQSKSEKDNAIAIGNTSLASGESSLAFGYKALASGTDSLAFGRDAEATGINSVALGAGSVAAGDNTISVGSATQQRKIVFVGNGKVETGSTDAINGGQLYSLGSSIATRLGGGSTVEDGIVTAPKYQISSGTYNNVGDALNAVNNSLTTITNEVDGLGDDALQWNGTAFSAKHGTTTTNKITNVAAGDVSATSTDAVNGSQLNTVKTDVATNTTNITNLSTEIDGLSDDALKWNGTDAFSASHGSATTNKITNVAAGDVSATSTDAVNGSQLNTVKTDVATNTTNITNLSTEIDGLSGDALKWNGTDAFSASHGTTATNKITNLAAGTVSGTSTDAINGSQLYGASSSVVNALGGGSVVNADGSISAPTYSVAGGDYNNVGDALTAIDDDMNVMGDTVTDLAQDALQWDDNLKAYSAKHGTVTTNKITNVAAGELSATSTDAVNGSQLNTVKTDVATNTTNITNLSTEIDGLSDDALQWNGTAFSASHGSVTTNKITNVAAGDVSATSTDAVNGSQLNTVKTDVATNTTNITNLSTEIDGLSDDALQWNGTAFSASHGSVTTNKITNVAAGDINAKSTDAINGSQLYDLSGEIASYFGGGAAVSDTGEFTGPTYTIGSQDYTSVGDALNAINASFNTSLGDALLWDSNASAFSASHGTSTASKIINVANGDVNATSTDAVNGGQLYGVSNSVADALGGDATVNADGTISAPNYTIAGNSYNNVGDALEAIDDDALLWDEDKGAFNAAHGTETASKITNVADGNISATSKDVVNGSQLNTTNMMINQNTALINQLAGDTSTTYVEENGAGVNYIRTNDTGLTFNDASASGEGATAVGYNASASGNSSIAIGRDSRSLVDGGIALGSGSVSNRVIATGSSDISVTENGVVIGYDTTDGELLGALSVGKDGESYRQIINVADGTEAHDVVTVRQLQNAIGAVATTPTKYYHANSTAEDSLAVGEDSLAMGAKTVVNGNAGIGIGLNTLVLADAINGIAIGSNASANHANSIAMGNGSQTTRGAQTGYTAYNMDAPQNSVGEFSVGSEDGQRQITNVAAGSADTDAVNVGQLKVTDERVAQNTQNISNLNNQIGSLDTRVTNIENNMGDIITTGSTKYFKTNSTGPDANAQGADSVAMGAGSIAAADNSVALGTGSVANEENTISVGSSTNQRRITNVAAGKNATDAVNVAQLKASEAGSVRYSTNEDGSVDYSNISLGDGKGGTTRISNVSAAVNDNDAVNYAQLKQSVQETTQYTDQRMAEMDHKLSKTESKLSGGIASAMAMTGLPQAYTPGASMASIGGGTYNGESAVALGVSMVSANGRWVYKLQGSTNSQGEYSAAVGAGIQW